MAKRQGNTQGKFGLTILITAVLASFVVMITAFAQTPTPTVEATPTTTPTQEATPTTTSTPPATPTSTPPATPTSTPTVTSTPTITPTPFGPCPIVQVPLNVNMLGDPVPSTSGKALSNIKEANDIFEQCCTDHGLDKPELTLSLVRFTAFVDPFFGKSLMQTVIEGLDVDPNDGLTGDEETALIAAADSVDFKDGGSEDKGFKIWVNPVTISPNKNGVTFNGYGSAIVGPTSGSGSENIDGSTWAHEVGHAVGELEHDDSGVDKGNVMHGIRSERTDSKLTKDQCEKLIEGFKKRRGAKIVESPSEVFTSGGKLVDLEDFESEEIEDELFEKDTGTGKGENANLVGVDLLFDRRETLPADHALEISITTAPPITGPIHKAQYIVRLDTDNDPSTGSQGADYKLLVKVFSPTDVTAMLKDIAADVSIQLSAPELRVLDKGGEFEAAPEEPREPIYTEITSRIPLSLLGTISHPISADAVSKQTGVKDMIPLKEINSQPPPGPIISLNPDVGTVGTNVTITGIGFTPNSTVSVLFDHDFLVNITSSTVGDINTTFIVPSRPPQRYSVDAVDENGLLDVNGFIVTT